MTTPKPSSVASELMKPTGPAPYYSDEAVTLYLGDCREVLPGLGQVADVCVTDPPYGETALVWDRWPTGWPTAVAAALPSTTSLWCFGSLRMFVDQADEFAGWRLAQDIVWEKPNGTGFAADRFKRVHEHAVQWYRGSWTEAYRQPQRELGGHGKSSAARKAEQAPDHTGKIGQQNYQDDGYRLVRSVLKVGNMRHKASHPTEKPLGILDPLIAYSCPPGGTVLDPFAGSGSTLDAARCAGRRAIGVEASEAYCEVIARRLSQGDLFGGAA